MAKKIAIVMISLILAGYIITYFQKYSLSQFSIIDININRNDINYMSVKNVADMEEALLNPDVEIIEIVNDIDLGYNIIKEEIKTQEIFEEHKIPLTHPKLKETGVSKLKIESKENLVIYSNNGSTILHCNLRIENSKNIKISNLQFKELWEWDEEGKAEYDRNDWDYITIKNSENICISSCEFSKSYDGITDIKNSKNVTIEYCKLNSIDINDEFYDEQFKYLENNKENYEMYKFLRDEIDLSYKEVEELFSYQFKVFLIECEEKDANIIIHDCLFLNAKTRIPLLSNGMAYLYNIYVDSTNLSNIMDKLIKSNKFYKIKNKYDKVVALNSYGAIARENAYIFAKNTVFEGAKYPYLEHEKGQWFKGFGKIIIYNKKDELEELRERLEKITGVRSE